MPGGDGTGPLGQGPMTGRGMGWCGHRGDARGLGRGRGRGAGACWMLGAGAMATIVAAVLAELGKQRQTSATE